MNESAAVTAPLVLGDKSEKQIMSGWHGSAETPLVSVICYTYNHVEFISDAIEGFLSQRTTFPFEVLIHDDASTDGTTEILSNYASRFPNIIRAIIQTDNQYSQGRRPPKFTFPLARGHYIALCEGDDYWVDRNKLARQVALLEKHPDLNLCIHPAHRMEFKSGLCVKMGGHGRTVEIKDVSEVLDRTAQYAPTASYVFRAKEAHSMPAWFFDDPLPFGDYFIEAILGRKGILYIPDTMSVYRHRVAGSYSERLRMRTISKIHSDYKMIVSRVGELKQYDGIESALVQARLSRTRCGYAWQFLVKGAYKECHAIALNRLDNVFPFRYLVIRFALISPLVFMMVSNVVRLVVIAKHRWPRLIGLLRIRSSERLLRNVGRGRS